MDNNQQTNVNKDISLSVLVCTTCGRAENQMKRCVGCHKVYYCSRTCQAHDWPIHKLQCGSGNKEENEPQKGAPVNFQTAFDNLKCEETEATGHTDKAQKAEFIIDKSKPVLNIVVKCHKEKRTVTIQEHWDAHDIMRAIINKVQIPADRLTLIHKGRKADIANIRSFMKDKAVFQAIGEKGENEEGLNNSDITLIMKQLSVERNVAIKALRETGDVVDAMLFISNK